MSDQLSPAYLQFWGKARPDESGGPAMHPAAYHNLDVAATAEALLSKNPRRLASLARLLSTSSENARRLLVTLVALHDIGKFAEAFQCMVPQLWPSTLGPMGALGERRHHTEIAFQLQNKLDWHGLLGTRWAPSEVSALWAAVAGHHGRPPSERDQAAHIVGMRQAGLDAALAYAKDVRACLSDSQSERYEPLAKPVRGAIAALSWTLAGLTNLADWIGSNSKYFPYCYPNMGLVAYWETARARAEIAIGELGILPARPARDASARKLFPAIRMPSPLQRHLSEMDLPEGPTLTIVEDVTGSGKTEAALLLAARLLADDRANGIFFALPTMATANAMFDRLGESYKRLFSDDAVPSLVLAHGRTSLHAGFQASILPPAVSDRDAAGAERRGDESSAVCAAWLADDRRKAFLAHVGIGTIDQAFLGVLPVKHQALRLWGLADRVLIVDEAHAYDAYMSRELERLLQFHSALGGSAIVLSATLPSAQRESLVRAFAKGLGARSQVQAIEAYPLVTLVSSACVATAPIATRDDRRRELPVRRIETVDVAIAHIVEMREHGAAVAWIRNTVDDAIEAAEALRAEGVDAALLHARFAMGDRLKIERHVRDVLGPGDRAGRRGFVLVGTQILEQSLDYDVDVMISDLAPVDLIIQRAGRLWRHMNRQNRPIATPELVILAPDWREVRDAKWYHQVSSRAPAVYRHHGIVWRTAKVLSEAGRISTPDGVRALIESVYAEPDLEDIPAPLRKASLDAIGKSFADWSIAGANLLDAAKGYGGNNTNWGSDTITPTRLGDPVAVFRLGLIEDGAVVPWCRADDEDIRRSWALSEVSLSRRKATDVPKLDIATEGMIARAKSDWGAWEQEQPLLVLSRDADGHSGEIVTKDGQRKRCAYRDTLGLRIVEASAL